MPLSGVSAEHALHAVPTLFARTLPFYGVVTGCHDGSRDGLMKFSLSARDKCAKPEFLTAGYQASEYSRARLLYPCSALTPESGISVLLVASMPYKAQPEPCALLRAWIELPHQVKIHCVFHYETYSDFRSSNILHTKMMVYSQRAEQCGTISPGTCPSVQSVHVLV